MINEQYVFINCPFDNDYFPLLKPLLFTVIYIGLTPQISETTDSGDFRLKKISRLMSESKYSIHDISRIEYAGPTSLPRFNMPFECGIDFGLKMSGREGYSDKRILILEREAYRYQKVMSDIAGNDIKAHQNKPEFIIKGVRDWFKANNMDVPWYKEIWLAYNEFEYDYENILEGEGYDPTDISSLTFSDIISFIKEWIEGHSKL
jgi:hypothetical protein